MSDQRSLLPQLEREYAEVAKAEIIESAHLFRLGRLALEIAQARHREHQLLAYVLASVLLFLARRAESSSVESDEANSLFQLVQSPARSAIAALKGSVDADQVVGLSNALIEAHASLIE